MIPENQKSLYFDFNSQSISDSLKTTMTMLRGDEVKISEYFEGTLLPLDHTLSGLFVVTGPIREGIERIKLSI